MSLSVIDKKFIDYFRWWCVEFVLVTVVMVVGFYVVMGGVQHLNVEFLVHNGLAMGANPIYYLYKDLFFVLWLSIYLILVSRLVGYYVGRRDALR